MKELTEEDLREILKSLKEDLEGEDRPKREIDEVTELASEKPTGEKTPE